MGGYQKVRRKQGRLACEVLTHVVRVMTPVEGKRFCPLSQGNKLQSFLSNNDSSCEWLTPERPELLSLSLTVGQGDWGSAACCFLAFIRRNNTVFLGFFERNALARCRGCGKLVKVLWEFSLHFERNGVLCSQDCAACLTLYSSGRYSCQPSCNKSVTQCL